MRVFFLFLLIINVLIGIWFYTQPVKNHLAIKPLPENLQRIEMLHEDSVKPQAKSTASIAKQVVVEASADTISADSTNKSGMVCSTLGPFKDEAILKQAQKQLHGQVLNISVRKREENQRHRYWVYMPVMASRAIAIEASKRLAQAKIGDYYRVRSGEKKNAISLGHYREKSHAERRVSNLKKAGFDTEVEVIFRKIDVFWLDYSIDESKDFDAEAVNEYLVDGVTRLDRNCK